MICTTNAPLSGGVRDSLFFLGRAGQNRKKGGSAQAVRKEKEKCRTEVGTKEVPVRRSG